MGARYMAVLLTCLLTVSQTEAIHFSDVNASDWCWGYVQEMAQLGYVDGYPDGSFRPEGEISHSEFVAILTRIAQLKSVSGGNDHWSAGSMQAALNAGWYDWDEIPPTDERFDQPIRRELAVKILMNALAPAATGDYNVWQPVIKDFSTLDGRYYNAVFAAYEVGIVAGDEFGNFGAKNHLSRAEACALLSRSIALLETDLPGEEPAPPLNMEKSISGGVEENGWLQVVGTQLCNERGKAVILQGMSSHGMQWYGQFASARSIATTRDYGANVFRVAMYTDQDGYITNPTLKNSVIEAVDAALALDMYVIIDWHILYDNDPNIHLQMAKGFFAEMAARYRDEPGVIYEICNEPNGNITWQHDIRPYAMEVIPVIRDQSPKSVVIVGTGTWSQDVDHVAAAPLAYDNVMYAFHFYVGTHGQALRDKVDAALNAGTPVFVTEWGASQASGGGGVYLAEAAVWLDFLEERGISWVNWSLCDKDESSAALRPGASPGGNWSWEQLSESGQFVFSRFN